MQSLNTKPTDEPDYYYENGFIVFTAAFLQKRGYCCRSGCRHCPYGYASEEQEREESD